MIYDWSSFDSRLAFETNLDRHITANDSERVGEYLCRAYDDFDPSFYSNHPCFWIISDAVKYLNKMGWTVDVCDCGEDDIQITCDSPDGKRYRSRFSY